MDGIDAVLVDMDTNTLIEGLTRPYSEEAQLSLHSILNHQFIGLEVLSQLNTLLGKEFALAAKQVLNKARLSSQQVVAIGSHGQTICHDAKAKVPYTVQLGCAHTIAELTGITVVADFRTRDLVIGGQGAPFAPVYHQALFAKETLPLAVVNIGGLSNVTFIDSNGKVSGYDIGPGNCLLDAWIQQHLDLKFDKAGEWAATGQVITPILSMMLADAYFNLPVPKSLGKEYFSLQWLDDFFQPKDYPQDVQATLLALTATTIAEALKKSTLPLKRVLICGGGVHNVTLINTLISQLPNLCVESTDALGIDPDYIEAMMFAFLAEKTLSHTPLDLNAITGSRHPAIYGVIYPAGIDK
jgi:anhydro-N-acetylmuramic acid kinase